jgi:hypothetical protein
MKNWWLLLVGFFAGLWWSERQRNETLLRALPQAEPPKSRTLAELSPTYAANPHPLKELIAVPEDDFVDHVHQLAAELVQPAMTPLEAKLAADYLGESLVRARVYDSFRQMMKDRTSEKWLYDAMDNEEQLEDE